MGVPPSAVARGFSWAEALGRPDRAQRDRVEVPDGHGLARCARAVRLLAHLAHPFPPVGPGRHLRTDAPGRTGPLGRGRRGRLAGVGRLHRRTRPPACGRGPKRGHRDRALGRSRGGLTSKIHLVCDAFGRPLAFVLTSGNTNDCTQFAAVMEAIRVPRVGPGRPRTRPAHVLGDKGYSSRAIRAWLRHRGISHTIPERADQIRNRLRRGSRGGRPPIFDKQLYKQRNVVERCFNRLKQWRGIATRYDKTAESYHAAVTLASLLMWA
ncbi:transposase (IS4 family) [Streptomyces sp. SPB78]|nr:transposase [Streptomyces sp. SPB78]EFK98130.1 transposase (IS4 family) [Streptomyces sp. SPB78]EFK99794.1 transposase (IS4 family) [Streptomyces sp. SPB78]EFK99841.1 transposase (IS4 family) [Streptomyces sp. SPB78]EFK99843.1 transposase (IS4 family) [Streptomyces sp. SPB78]